MLSKVLVPLAAALLVGCSAAPYTSGGPLGPTVSSRKPAPPPQAAAGAPENFEPGSILVQPKPGQTLDDLKRQFGADNVKPFRPDGIDENLAAELGLDNWFVVKVPEGDELGALSGLIEKGDVLDARPAPRGTTQRS